jgi:transcriptional regulator with XRE-family HTH domain
MSLNNSLGRISCITLPLKCPGLAKLRSLQRITIRGISTDTHWINSGGYMQTAKELLGMRIREVRKARGLSQEKLAEKVGVDPKQISRIEGGKSAPSFETLESIAIHLQVEMKDLLDFQHLVAEERIEDQVLRLLGMMDEKTKRLAVRILHTLAS